MNLWSGQRNPLVILTGCWLPLLLASANPAFAIVELSVTRAGLPTTGGVCARPGSWLPIVVDLSLVNQDSFTGTLRVGQFDNDGDEALDRVAVHLRAESGGSQRYFLYTVANPLRADRPLAVELFDQDGEAVEVLAGGEPAYRAMPSSKPTYIQPDDLFVLSVSTGTMGRVRDLDREAMAVMYDCPIHVGHISPMDLPELWIGLEAVDVIVWDEADADDLNPRQVDALINWARNGGTLMIAASQSAGTLKLNKKLAPLLPLTLGDIAVVDNLVIARERLLGNPLDEGESDTNAAWEDYPFVPPIPVSSGVLREGSVALPRHKPIPGNLLAERPLELGRIVFMGVTLRDLFRGPGDASNLFEKVLHLRKVASTERGRPRPASLFDEVMAPISFSTRGGMYLLAAAFFSVAYVVVATFGTWGFLSAKKWRQHSWSLFAVVAMAASLLSVLAVNWLQGFGQRLHQVSVIDLTAGESVGVGSAFYGLKTSADSRLDIWLPRDHLGADEPADTDCFLRPLPGRSDRLQATATFADPIEYRLVPGSAVIENARFRATLKQFEGRWSGSLGGSVAGRLFLKGRQLTGDSYIVNELGVDLTDCWLLHAVETVERRKPNPSASVYAFPIGDIRGGDEKIDISARCYTKTPQQIAEGLSNHQLILQSELTTRQEQWTRPFLSMLDVLGGQSTSVRLEQGDQLSAMMLLTTVGDFDYSLHQGLGHAYGGDRTWSRDGMTYMNLSGNLQPDSALLVGFARTPGPARLFARAGTSPFRLLKPEEGHALTMYRVRLPVTVLDNVPVEDDDDEKNIRRVN